MANNFQWERNSPYNIHRVIYPSNSEIMVKELYDWLIDENREPAQTKFTSGWQRTLAKEIEFRISQNGK